MLAVHDQFLSWGISVYLKQISDDSVTIYNWEVSSRQQQKFNIIREEAGCFIGNIQYSTQTQLICWILFVWDSLAFWQESLLRLEWIKHFHKKETGNKNITS